MQNAHGQELAVVYNVFSFFFFRFRPLHAYPSHSFSSRPLSYGCVPVLFRLLSSSPFNRRLSPPGLFLPRVLRCLSELVPGSRLGGALAALLGLPIGNGGTVSYYTEHRYIVQLDTADSSTIYRAVTCLDLMASCSIGREAREPANFWYFLDVRHFASLKHNGQIEILATHYCSCAAAFLSPPLSLPLSPSLYSFFLSLSSFPPPFSLLLSPPLPPQSDATNAGRLLVGCLVLLSASVNFSLHAFSTKIMNAVIAAVRAEWSTRSPFAAVVAAAASRSALHSAVRMLIFLHH